MKAYIGCSGFSYKEWKDVFYPPKLPSREWFNYYSERFSTLELNVSFYKFPTLKTLLLWHEKSPEHFIFSVKAPQLITHYKQMKECTSLLVDFYTVCRDGLLDKLGPLLFQFPARFVFSEERLDRIVKQLDPAFLNVVEFRDKSWWNEKVGNALAAANIAFCGQSFPNLPDDVVRTANFLYYRFHGIPDLYYSKYNEEEIKEKADQVLAQSEALQSAFVYFNNTAAIGAIDNARWMESYLGEQLLE